jgi:DNA-binding SARP family transcriptional activator
MADNHGTISIRMFGGLCLLSGETLLARLPAQQTTTLLALLALNHPRSCSRDDLAAALWPEIEPAEGRRRLRQTLFKLRRQIEAILPSGADLLLSLTTELQQDPACVSTDVLEFEQAVYAASRARKSQERIAHLKRAEALYQGELLPGCYLEAIISEQHRLECVFMQVLDDLSEALLDCGETEDAHAVALRAVERDPTSEKAHTNLMRLYAVRGKPLWVARQYRELERLLQEAFEEPPSMPARALAHRLQQEAAIRAATVAAANPTFPADSGARPALPVSSVGPGRVAPVVGMAPPPPAAAFLSALPERAVETTTECLGQSAGAVPPAGAALAVASAATERPGRQTPVAVLGLILLALTYLGVHATPWARRSAPGNIAGSVPPQASVPSVFLPLKPDARKSGGRASAGLTIAGSISALRRVTLHPETSLRSPVRRTVALTRTSHPDIPPGPLARRDPAKLARRSQPASYPPGTELWERRVELRPGDKGNTGKGNDATAIIADPTGGVFVLGFVDTLKADVDFLILKYSAQGKLLWERRYDGPGHDCDRARSGAVDAEGNLYVTGESDGGVGDGKGNHNCWDVATMKFERHGKPLWVRRWAGPGNNADEPVKLCLDAHRNVYVTAKSNYGDPPRSGYDWVTLKYDTNGKLLWDPPRRFGGPGDDEPTDMEVDRDGNVYVCGYETLNGPSINTVARVRDGKVIGEEPLNELCECVIVKYTAAGEQKWVRAYKATGYVSARPAGMALDRDGNIITVATRHAPTISDLLVRKYDRDGRMLWEKHCSLGGGSTGGAAGIATDRTGRIGVLATVNSDLTTTGEDLLTVLYDRAGTLLWSDTVDGAAHGCDNACALTTDRAGNFIVFGTVDNGRDEARFTAADYVTMKYAPNGRRLWTRYYNGNLCHDDFARALTVDGQGDTYVVGQSDPGHGRPLSIVTVKYAP